MQTFLPYPNFKESASVLDNKRLGKQRVECKQILNALRNQSKGWVNHPATKMWHGYEDALARYGYAICEEWRSRGFKDTLLEFFDNEINHNSRMVEMPVWWAEEEFHASHRANLLRKDYEFYSKYGWTESPDLPYVWPV